MTTQRPAPGGTSLTTLLSTLTTTLHPSTYVFSTLLHSTPIPSTLLPNLQMLFREAESEGITLIIKLEDAVAHGLEYVFECRMITLNVHSSLEAVGFMAVVATRLAERGIGVNPVSGFCHDHLFVPVGREGEAVEVLRLLAVEMRKDLGVGK